MKEKRYQVFISSTYTDLIKERQAAVESILTAGHIPAGMELFTAGDVSQMEVIRSWIDNSDVFMLILGDRYGSIEPTTQKSYTELEFEYALSQGKPLFSIVSNGSEESLKKVVEKKGLNAIERLNTAKYSAFRKRVLSNMVRFWDDWKDVKIATTESLSKITQRNDLDGWIRLSAHTGDFADAFSFDPSKTWYEVLNSVQKNYHEKLLTHCKGDPNEAIKISGLGKSTYYDTLRRHGIQRSDYESGA